jgi:hypothetical protein
LYKACPQRVLWGKKECNTYLTLESILILAKITQVTDMAHGALAFFFLQNITYHNIIYISFLGDRFSLAVELIQNTAVNISATTCVKWRLKISDDQYYIRFIGSEDG